tara:strand:+ start:8909 stop:9067 length:159 start_codon:yes stop_codon:yes gene_type:complete
MRGHEKALQALFTDPYSGLPYDRTECIIVILGLVRAVAITLALIVLALGLTP